jgi:LPXTG-motif cell wall-anchored protein
VLWDAVDKLPATGVEISVLVFGGLTLLIFGLGLFLTSRRYRRHRRHLRPSPTARPPVLTGLILAEKTRKGFDGGATGQTGVEGGESGPPED